MNRRDFLKGILAGATVAAVPGIIVNQLPKATVSMITDGEWHHMAYTWKDGRVVFFLDNIQMVPVDGLVDRYVSFEKGKGLLNLHNYNMKGGQSGRSLFFWTKGDRLPKMHGFSDIEYRGALSDVVVYDRQLTVSDIKKLNKRGRS